MRVENNVRTGSVSARGAARGNASGAAFHVSEGGQPARPAAASGVAATAPIDALLALQAVEDSTQGRKRQLRRGRSLLDTLEALKADLLVGQISEARLGQLVAVITQARERTEPGLDALLDDIELRARVELAKRGFYPAF